MKELLAYVAKSLVDNPEAVQVKEVDCDGEVILELRVASEDMGKVIGKHGKNARSIRAVMKAAAAADGKKSVVDIAE